MSNEADGVYIKPLLMYTTMPICWIIVSFHQVLLAMIIVISKDWSFGFKMCQLAWANMTPHVFWITTNGASWVKVSHATNPGTERVPMWIKAALKTQCYNYEFWPSPSQPPKPKLVGLTKSELNFAGWPIGI